MGEECCCWTKVFTWGSVVVLIAFYLFKAILKAVSRPYSQMPQTDNERYFYDPSSKERARFPSILSAPSVYLSVVVPSYNEESRLPIMLDKAFLYLEERKKRDSKFSYEVIVVDDGSRDSTSKVALEYSRKYTTDVCRVLTLETNRGKGGAVRMGVMKSRGKLVLFADADDAAKFSDFENLENTIKSSEGFEKEDIVVCGSRRSLEKESIAKRSAYRTFLMYGFHFLVWFLCVRGIRDTQCGFKLFTRSAALKCFSNLHVMRWAFDVDLLYIAEHLRMPVHEVDINWHECEGSKLTVGSYIQMGLDLVSIRAHYLFGAWKINENYRISD